MRRRFFASSMSGDVARIEGQQAVHLARVLRAQTGQHYELAHEGRVFVARVLRASPRTVEFALEQELAVSPEESVIELAAALFKFERWEWMVEKATELGVTKVQPVLSRRTDARLATAVGAKLERWRTIAFEAAQQARRCSVPEIAAPLHLEEILAAPPAAARILLAEGGTAPALTARTGAVCLLCGPEGGWTGDEVAAAGEAGFVSASLGPRILRCETAALAALARLAA